MNTSDLSRLKQKNPQAVLYNGTKYRNGNPNFSGAPLELNYVSVKNATPCGRQISSIFSRSLSLCFFHCSRLFAFSDFLQYSSIQRSSLCILLNGSKRTSNSTTLNNLQRPQSTREYNMKRVIHIKFCKLAKHDEKKMRRGWSLRRSLVWHSDRRGAIVRAGSLLYAVTRTIIYWINDNV